MAASPRRIDRLVVGGVVDQDVEAAETPGHVVDHCRHSDVIGDVAGEGSGIDLVERRQLTSDIFCLTTTLGINDGDMDTLPRQGVADSLPEPTIAARHQRDQSLQVHERAPACQCAATSLRL